MMLQNILSIIYSFINVLGTVWAVLSILKMRPSDVCKSITYGGLMEADEHLLIQKEQARYGITFVIIGFILQSINLLVCVNSIEAFVGWIVFTVILLIAIYLIEHHLNICFRKKYKQYKEAHKAKSLLE